jgi:hypothetical protein
MDYDDKFLTHEEEEAYLGEIFDDPIEEPMWTEPMVIIILSVVVATVLVVFIAIGLGLLYLL